MADTKEITLEELKQEALLHGISFKGNISKAALKALIDEKKKTQTEEVGVAVSSDEADEEEYEDYETTFSQKRVTKKEIKELKEQALLMLKVRVTNLNPEESDAPTVYAGVVTNYFRAARYIPFDKVWYVEQCLVDKLLTDKMQVFVNDIDPRTRRPNGNKKAKLVKHYNIEFVK